MDYKELVDKLRNNNIDNNCHDCALGYYAFEAATAITDLLARAEAAEKELADCKEKNAGLALALLTEQPPNSDCLGEQEWQAVRNRVRWAEARAEKAERERDAAIQRIKEDHWC